MTDQEWQEWDRQIEKDDAAGKLDWMKESVDKAIKDGTLMDINDFIEQERCWLEEEEGCIHAQHDHRYQNGG